MLRVEINKGDKLLMIEFALILKCLKGLNVLMLISLNFLHEDELMRLAMTKDGFGLGRIF